MHITITESSERTPEKRKRLSYSKGSTGYIMNPVEDRDTA